jgi:adenylate cyclase
VIVAWSPAAVASDNVKAEARRARQQGRLLQVFVEACEPPLFFGERQGVDLAGWTGDMNAPGWRKVAASVAELTGGPGGAAAQAPHPVTPARKHSICVLPFANMSGDPEQEYFSDGISEDIITDLAKVSALSVVARNTAFTFKGKAVDVRQVARQLGVAHVLEGSGSASPPNSSTGRPATMSGPNATIAFSTTSSPSRTRSPRRSSAR